MTSRSAPDIEFWFDFGSNYSYLSVMRIEAEAQRRGVRVIWKPFLLGPILRALGMDNSPFVLQKEKGAYVWQDMIRQCRKYGLGWAKPTAFPRASVLPSRVALLGADAPWIGAFCRQVMELNFVLDEDINQAERLAPILTGLGLSATAILEQAQTEFNKTRLREQTDEARAGNIWRSHLLRWDGVVLGQRSARRRASVCGRALGQLRCLRPAGARA